MSKKVLVITYYWPPSGGAGVQRWLKFCKYLPDFNVEPLVVTVHEDHAAYPALDSTFEQEISPNLQVFKTKATNFYNLYSSFKKDKKVPQGGVPKGGNSWKSKLSLFARNHLFVPDPRKGWNSYAFKQAKALIDEHNITTIITTSPPHSTQLIGLALKKAFPNLRWIADMRDPWTDIYYYKDLNHSRWSDQQNKQLELEVLSKADVVTVVSPGMQRLFAEKGTEEDKLKVIPNGFDKADFPKVSITENTDFSLAYVGTANADYKMDAFANALQTIVGQNHAIKWNVVGVFDDETKRLFSSNKLKDVVTYHGYLKHEEAIGFTKSAHLLILVIPDVPNNDLIYSGKLFEYIASGRPILCIGPKNGDAARLINELGAGKTFDYGDEDGMSDFILEVKNGIFKSRASSDEALRLSCSRAFITEKMAQIILNE